MIQSQLVRRGAQSRHVAEVLNTIVGESDFLMEPLNATSSFSPRLSQDPGGSERARTFSTPAVEDGFSPHYPLCV